MTPYEPLRKIDVHTHVVPPRLPTKNWGDAEGRFLRVEQSGAEERRAILAGELVRVVDRRAWEPAARLAAMDASGTEVHVLSPTPFTFLYDAPTEIAAGVARWQNEYLAEFRDTNPERFRAFGSLPLQDADASLDELRFLQEDLGLQGVELGTHVGALTLDDEVLRPVFAELERRSLSVLIHPYEALQPVPEGLTPALGYPMATAGAIVRLLWGGTLGRFPELRLCFAHGGGCLSSVAGRLQATYERFPARRGQLGEPPKEALRRVWADCLVFDHAMLSLVLSVFGEDRVVVGSDFPFALSDETMLQRALDLGAVSTSVAQRIARDNPLLFLGEGV